MTSVARRQEQDDSGEYSDASQDVEHSNSGNDGGQHESDYDSQGSESDHSERDPENQETERRVDDDEDRSNPQYIPKRGTFYEHDDRTAASGEETTNTTSETPSEKKEGSETPAERRRPPRKSDVINKWSHDKYNENEQMPKSRDELVAIYGYDIRNEDAPPHARRNRRYGRGPNKYTRTWEDEEAYRRQNAQAQPRKPPNPEDFPELDSANKYSNKKRPPRPRSKSQPPSNESSENGSQQLRRNASIKTPKAKTERPKPNNRVVANNNNNNNNSKPTAKQPTKEKLPAIENLTITATVFNNSQGQNQRKVNTVAQQRPVPTDQRKPAPKPQQNQPPSNSAPNKSPPQTAQQKPTAQQNNQPPASGPESRGGSKRYSSLRQRPLAETYSPQQQQQQQTQQQQQSQQLPAPQQQQQQQPQQQPIRYNEYPANSQSGTQHQGSPVPQIHPQQLIHQQVHRGAQPHGPSPPHALPAHAQQVRLGIMEQQQLVSHPHHQLHNMPQPHTMGQLQPAQGYAPPAMMPAQYMQPPSQTGNSGVMCSPLYPQPTPPYPHQVYPHHNYATQAGGVTYYSCAEQEQLPRAQRRPTAAIPIVRPHTDRPANSSEKDNIDRIVENMFVRKPWPATHGADSKEKPQTENRSSQEPQSKESSQPNSLTSSSISTDSKPSENKEVEEPKEVEQKDDESITTDA
ncbi:uncharacterized protein LOC106135915 isoform X1 [Amyelois transitella]|uniref:uncharacterized protein LOC106135915 isoform X1 n=1 Tax=Amyelois transitella TaxID=680683 RepID=UPI00298F65E8|nr:uncharacterized protein LOC106135915 isoform X1 [Amyelois transitella]